jgi:hypothetical protein
MLGNYSAKVRHQQLAILFSTSFEANIKKNAIGVFKIEMIYALGLIFD